jgi:hydroxymethylbilane synthase
LSFRVATRASALARWQADHVAALLRAREPGLDVELVPVSTSGDRQAEVPLAEIGGKGVFVKEVQVAVLEGRADVAVHSAKDLPSVTPDDLEIVAVPERGDARDALVGGCLDDLAVGACVATGSVRRRAQLAWHRPDLTFVGLRGNIATRLERVPAGGAIVVAQAALDRLDLGDRADEVMCPSVMLPQVGQGALAVECRVEDEVTRERLRTIDHGASHRALDAERGFLAELGGDCDIPAAAHAIVGDDGSIALDALVASLDGRIVVRDHRAGGPEADAPALGRHAARALLDDAGAADLLLHP